MVRQSFGEQLKDLEQDILRMGELVDKAIVRSVRGLSEQDVELARQVIADDAMVNQAQRDIEEKCVILIATQQPLASDLRTIMSISNIATELERMGDYAKGTAQIAVKTADQPLLKPLIDLPRMAEKGRELLRGQLDAFIRRDAETAELLSAEDDEVDGLYDQVYHELMFFMVSDPRTITRATYLLWVAHDMERISDRTTNIAEQTVYLVTGEVKELNVKPEMAQGR